MRIRRCIARLAVSAALCSATLWQASGGPPNTDYITPPFTFSPLAQVIGAIAVVISLFCPAPNEQPPANASFRDWVGFPLLVFVLLAMIRSRWFHYLALLALIAYRLLNYWNFMLAP